MYSEVSGLEHDKEIDLVDCRMRSNSKIDPESMHMRSILPNDSSEILYSRYGNLIPGSTESLSYLFDKGARRNIADGNIKDKIARTKI